MKLHREFSSDDDRRTFEFQSRWDAYKLEILIGVPIFLISLAIPITLWFLKRQ